MPEDAGAPENAGEVVTKKKSRRSRKPRGNEPRIPDLAEQLTRICGMRVDSIDGIDVITIMTVISEVGTDLEARFRARGHFASWIGLSPGKDWQRFQRGQSSREGQAKGEKPDRDRIT